MKFRKVLLALAALLFCTASIFSQSGHTWVSGSGNDVNPCTFTSPCATFQVALGNTSPGGVITAKDAGDFGTVTIWQSVTIDGNNLGSITYNSSEKGVEIEGGANVTLQNLTINGLGSGESGIYVFSGGSVSVLNCKIMNNVYEGIYFAGAGTLTVANSWIGSFIGTNDVFGIDIASNAAQNVLVRDTIIDASPQSNYNDGIVVSSGTGPVKASLQNVSIIGAGGIAVWAESGLTEVTGSVISQSTYGVNASNGATVSVASSLITANTTGVCSNTASKIRLDNNDIYDNATAIANCGGIVKTSTTNKTSGTISIPAADVSDSVTF